MRDIQLLTLYKQHYMNNYKHELKSQFSCWGYFDGMDIDRVSVLSSQKPISQLWNAIEEKQEEAYGGYSCNSIGIFRCASEDEDICDNLEHTFWEEYESMPFFAVVFLQLNNSSNYEEISRRIEYQYENLNPNKSKCSKCNVLAYATYDNADIVVLLSSNKISVLNKKVEHLHEMVEVEYLYSVIGVSSQYLEDSYNKKEFHSFWKGTKCFLQDAISKISLQIVAKGNDVIYEIKQKLEDSCRGEISCHHDFGHTNATITIMNSDVETLLSLMLPKGIITHQNEFYGETIYNIETSFTVEEDIIAESKKISGSNERGISHIRDWCEKSIYKYKKKLAIAKENNDVSLSSHYRAIIQTLNTLAQYEQFTLGKEIFYLLFPGFYMFERLLDETELQNYGVYSQNEEMKKTIRHFIDSVHSVMCHAVSNRQTFFMIPGYSGISFSVPIKLTLMYLWLIKKVSNILNDCNYQYECILIPEMESDSITSLLDFGVNNENRLINVHVAQRLLFFPENLMIILAHEVGHYIGKGIRNRKIRAQCILHTMAYALTEMIFTGNITAVNIEQKYISRIYVEQLQKELRKKALLFLYEKLKESGVGPEYYSEDLQEFLIDCGKIFLVAVQKEWQNDLPNILKEAVRDINMQADIEDKKYRECMQYIYEIASDMKNNIQNHLASNTVDKIVIKIMRAYREAFSDMVALGILECSETDFTNTFFLEEGVHSNKHKTTDLQFLREQMVYFVKNGKYKNGDIKNESLDTIQYRKHITNNIYECKWMKKWLMSYAKSCYENIQDRIAQEEISNEVEQVRKCYERFKYSNQISCSQIYNSIVSSNNEYIEIIEKKYQHIMRYI